MTRLVDRRVAEPVRDLAQPELPVDRLPLGYLVFDKDYRLVEWNRTAPAAASLEEAF